MRTAIIILSVVAGIVAEAPYHLPRPAPHAPALHYPAAPAPPPPPPPPPQLPQFSQLPQPAPQHIPQPQSGYNYSPPNIAPVFVQPAPQPQYIQPAPRPQYIQPAPRPQYLQPAPQPQYVQPAPRPQYIQPAPQPQYIQPAPQPQYVYQQPAPIPIQTHPEPVYHQPAPAPAPVPAPQPLPQPIQYQPPRPSYGVPVPRPIPQPQPIQFAPAQPQPRPQSQAVPSVVHQQQQFSIHEGYSYQQPLAPLPIQPQFAPQLPLQANSLTTSGLSSYQADSNQYHSAQEQTHREALDSLVVNRVQNIITENEHSSARDAGYQSLVSGVSLENAKPSREILSFVHTSPLHSSESSGASSSSLAVSSASGSSPSTDYGVPSFSSNQHTEHSGSESSSLSFLPNTKPAVAYGPPK